MDLEHFLQLANAYQDMGQAVQEQLQDVLDGGDPADKNPYALDYAREFLTMATRFDIEGAEDALEEIAPDREGTA